jgi:hypothetical protein
MAIHAYTMIVNRQTIAKRLSSLHYRPEVIEGIPSSLQPCDGRPFSFANMRKIPSSVRAEMDKITAFQWHIRCVIELLNSNRRRANSRGDHAKLQ